MDRQRRIILHPGFHRTGTRSVAAFLSANRARLAPHLGLLLPSELVRATALTTNYATDLNPLRLTDMVETMDDILAENGLHPILNDGRDMVISAPDLAGTMPGAPGIAGYDAAPVAIAYLAGYLTERFPDSEVVVVLTTRGPRDWLYSTWRGALLNYRIRQDWPTFSATLARAANLDHAVVQVARAIEPVAAFTLPLEDAHLHPQGPGGAILEMIDLPDDLRGTLVNAPLAGRGPSPELAARLLDLNTSDLPKKLLVDEKALLMRTETARLAGGSPAERTAPPRREAGRDETSSDRPTGPAIGA